MRFGQRHMLQNILADAGEGGSAGAPPVSTANTATETPSGDAPAFVAPEWAKGLTVDPEILKAPMFSSVKNIDDVVKGYYHAQKLVGSDKAIVPGKNATDEEWKAYYVKAGLPESFEDYKAELPSTFDNQDFNAGLLKKAYELNIKPDQLAAIVSEVDKYNEMIVQEYESTQQNEIKSTAESLKKEWGPDFQRNVVQAQRVIKHFAGDAAYEQILNSPLANNGDFLRLMAKIGGQVTKEDTFSQDVTTTFGMSAADAKRKVNDIYANPKHPFFDDSSPKHKDAVEEMLKYQKIMSQSA